MGKILLIQVNSKVKRMILARIGELEMQKSVFKTKGGMGKDIARVDSLIELNKRLIGVDNGRYLPHLRVR